MTKDGGCGGDGMTPFRQVGTGGGGREGQGGEGGGGGGRGRGISHSCPVGTKTDDKTLHL